MAVRKIIKIDEERCNGCGLCIPNCAEGALQIVDGKVKLVKDIYCDGLGACLGHCPEDALTIEERDAPEFDVEAVEQYLEEKTKAGSKSKTEPPSPGRPFPGPMAHPSSGHTGCPSSRAMHFKPADSGAGSHAEARSTSALSHWPVQLKLVPVNAPYFQNADLLVVADCVPFAYPNFHQDFLRGKAMVVGCPKLDDIEHYRDKLTEIFRTNSIKSITLPHMEVPCCLGLVRATEDALRASGKNIPLIKVRVGIRGDIQREPDVSRGTHQNRENGLRR